MASPNHEVVLASPYRPFTAAERIQQLNSVDKSIAELLRSAGLAIKTLSNAQDESSVIQTPPSATARKELFIYSANRFISTLQSIDVQLQRSIVGLEEAGITVPGRVKKYAKQDTSSGAGAGNQKRATEEVGLSNLDVGCLNSRSGRVAREIEAELWAKAKLFSDEVNEDSKPKSTEEDVEEDIQDNKAHAP